MDNNTAWAVIEYQKRLIEALGMHWENEQRKVEGKSMAYTEGDFFNLAHRP